MSQSNRSVIKRKILARGARFTAYRDIVAAPGGKKIIREWFRRTPVSAIIPVLSNHKIILVRQYRHGANQTLWEIPAGGVSKNETPRQTARRECIEETGYRPRKLRKLTQFFSSPAHSDEVVHVYIASHLKQVGQSLEPDEDIDVRAFSKTEVRRMLNNNKIRDAKSMIALRLFLDFK